MRYKTWCRLVILLAGLVIGGLFAALYIIDPIGLWGSPLIAGVNNYKEKQQNFLDVYKPFELRHYEPENIYIGTSRVYVGWEAEENAYNLGMSSLSLPDMRDYLHYVYSLHVPQRVYIGLDLFQFADASVKKPREGFSRERLAKLEKGGLYVWDELLAVNMGMRGYLGHTISTSRAHPHDKPIFTRGFCALRGEKTEVDSRIFYDYLHDFYDTYDKWNYDPDAIEILQATLDEAKANGVEVILFFNPVAVDLLALQDICQVADDYQEIKRAVAKLHPVYDFAWVNPITMDREKYWLDPSHYHSTVAEKMKLSMNDTVDQKICKLLTEENAEESLVAEQRLYDSWANEHLSYREALHKAVPRKIEDGALRDFLNF